MALREVVITGGYMTRIMVLETCPKCEGSGAVTVWGDAKEDWIIDAPCPECKGTGEIANSISIAELVALIARKAT